MRTHLVLVPLLLAPSLARAQAPTQGDVFVLDGSNDAVVRVDPDAYSAGSPPSNQTLVTSGNLLSSPFDVAIGDGALFITDRGLGGIVRVDLATANQSQVPVNVGGTPFALDPRGIAIDAQGRLLVLEGDLFTIVRIDPVTGAVADLTPSIFFGGLAYIDLGPGDAIFVTETDGTIVRVLPQTQQRQTVGSVLGAQGLVVDDQTGLIYVADSSDDVVVRIDPAAYEPGNPAANRQLVSDDPLLTNPADIGLLPDGDLVVTNSSGGNVEMVRIEVASGAATTVAMGGDLTAPTGLAVVVPEFHAPAAGVLALATLAALRRPEEVVRGAPRRTS